MTERLIEKIDRLATEAGVTAVTPELRRFALLVRADTVAEWPKNFCPRCGKRTADLTVIHTCTPPRGLEMT